MTALPSPTFNFPKDRLKIVFRFSLWLSLFSVGLAGLHAQGPLTPPGAPAPTMKTLAQIEPRTPISSVPFTISAAGSYYLTTNLSSAINQNGIVIDADDVTIDLNGFTLLGVGGSLDGIGVLNSHANLAVRGGSVRGWSGAGVNLSNARNCRFDGLMARGNGGDGMRGGDRTVVRHCVADANGAVGIAVGSTSTIRDCSAAGNTNGFAAASAIITGCNADNNTARGFSFGSSSVVSDCSTFNNGTEGFFCNGSGSVIRHCSATFNTGDGIQVFGDVLVLQNECDSNGQGAGIGAGIHLMAGGPGTGGRIQGNNVTDNDTGIKVDTAGHFIIQNTSQGNTVNYDIVANNKVGVIVAAPNSGAINGSTGGAGVGSTDPWANFSY